MVHKEVSILVLIEMKNQQWWQNILIIFLWFLNVTKQHCKKMYILKNCGNWQINIDSTNCFPNPDNSPQTKKCIVVILAEGLKLNLKIYIHRTY